jgi:hypothetical protein
MNRQISARGSLELTKTKVGVFFGTPCNFKMFMIRKRFLILPVLPVKPLVKIEIITENFSVKMNIN